MNYAIVTPVRNETENLSRLAESLCAQSLRPSAWMIVDTGSDDGTPAMIAELIAEHDWIATCTSTAGESPTRARAIVHGFNVGVQELGDLPEVVVKLDADVSMEPDYFERLVAAFREDEHLGIASGTCFEREQGEWTQRHVTGDHVWGATRAYRSSTAATSGRTIAVGASTALRRRSWSTGCRRRTSGAGTTAMRACSFGFRPASVRASAARSTSPRRPGRSTASIPPSSDV